MALRAAPPVVTDRRSRAPAFPEGPNTFPLHGTTMQPPRSEHARAIDGAIAVRGYMMHFLCYFTSKRTRTPAWSEANGAVTPVRVAERICTSWPVDRGP